MTHAEIYAFVEKYTPLLIKAFEERNIAFEALPSGFPEDVGKEELMSYSNAFGWEVAEDRSVEWRTVFQSVQTRVESERNPAIQQQIFDEFLRASSKLFGDEIESDILEAIKSDTEFRHLAFLVTNTSTQEQVMYLDGATRFGNVSSLYYKSIGQVPSAFNDIANIRYSELETTQAIASVQTEKVAINEIAVSTFLDSVSENIAFVSMRKWLNPENASIYEKPDGSLIIQQDESTQITLRSDFQLEDDPEIEVVVGKPPFTEHANGNLRTLDKTVEQANGLLFVRYGLDAEEFIPGGFESHQGRELALKLAGLFLFDKPIDQRSAENDGKFESLAYKTDSPEFREMLKERFGINVPMQDGVSPENAKEQLRSFLSSNGLLTKTGVLVPKSKIEWTLVLKAAKSKTM